MVIYPAEENIKDLITANMAVASNCGIEIDISNKIKADSTEVETEVEDDCESVLDCLRPEDNFLKLNRDTAWFPAILVTSNWNANDDVFTPLEMVKGASTPIMKPVNWMHNMGEDSNNEVIGVINSASVVDEFYNVIEPESVKDNLHKIHIAVGMLIWSKSFPAYAEDIQTGLKNKKLFVSMECWVYDFGYALQAPNSTEIILLDRDANTAGLTKYLRWVKGPGKVTIRGLEYKIGRWVKNPLFSGVGCVYKPANKESIPLSNSLESVDKSLFRIAASTDFEENGVLFLDPQSKGEIMKDDKVMCECNVAAVKAELDSAKASIAALTTALDQAKAETLAAKAESESHAMKWKDMEAKAADAEAKLSATVAEVTQITAAKADIEAKYNEMRKTEIGRARAQKMGEITNIEDADKAVAEFGNMSDSEFDMVLKYATAAAGKPRLTDQTQTGLPKLTDQTKSGMTKLTDAVAKASENTEVSETVEAVATAGAKTETIAEIGKRIGEQLAEAYKKNR